MIRDRYDLVVVGAGPAGMAAAATARELGLEALVADEQPGPGGQIHRGVETTPRARGAVLGPSHRRGTALAHAFRESGAHYLPGATVWEVTPDRFVGIEAGGTIRFVRAERVVIATGALERPFPIPGWTLPGVMTAGAAQILLKTTGAVPGEGTVLAGTGPLLYLVAVQVARAGGRLRAVLDTTPAANYARALPHLARALGRPGVLREGLALLGELARSGTRWIRGVRGLRVEGDGRARAVVYRRDAAEERVDCDAVLLHQGVVPNVQLAMALRCAHRWDERQLCFRPVCDAAGRTSVEGVLVAGDGAGIAGARAAEHAGRVAATAAALDLGRLDRRALVRCPPDAAALARERRARPFLEALYRPADAFRLPDDAVLACRCEEITAGELRRLARAGVQGPNQLKAFTRAGMGPCQGRLCGLTVAEIVARTRGVGVDAAGHYRLRPPIKPVGLGALADMAAPRVAADAPPEAPVRTAPDP